MTNHLSRFAFAVLVIGSWGHYALFDGSLVIAVIVTAMAAACTFALMAAQEKRADDRLPTTSERGGDPSD